MDSQSNILDRDKLSMNLPSLPQVLIRLLEACNDEDATPRELSEITSKDPAVSARVMRLVNSAYMGFTQKVDSIEKAIVYIGTDTLKNIAVTASVLTAFHDAEDGEEFRLGRFWWHSFMVGSLAKIMAKEVSYPSPDEAFISGLLHDIGKLVLWEVARKEYSSILKKTVKSNNVTTAERKVFGFTHAYVGAELIRKWKLKSFMADAILYHHADAERIAESFPLLKIIFTANLLANAQASESSAGVQAAKEVLGLDESKVEAMLAEAEEDVRNAAEAFEIEVEPPADSYVRETEAPDNKKKELVDRVKDNSLLLGTLQNLIRVDGRDEILQVVKRGLQILFDVKNVFFFLHEPGKKILSGVSLKGAPNGSFIDELAIPFNGSKNLLVKALSGRCITSSFNPANDEQITIADEQLIRLLNSDGMVCLPLIAYRQPVGVVVMGVNEIQCGRLLNQRKLMTIYANHSAVSLYIDQMKQTQQIRIDAERREASTAIARKVSHEVNNPLGIIKNYLKILGMKLPEEELIQNELKIISEEIDRVGHIIRQLTALSGQAGGRQEQIDLNKLITGNIQVMTKSILEPARLKAHLDLDPDLPTVLIDKNKLVQVMINLVKNAAEAMPDGGNIYIETKYLKTFGKKLLEGEKKTPAGVRITVRDDGPGMPENIKAKIFEPANTSKGEGHSGLGLSIVHGIIMELKGTIDWSSEDGTGTEFVINLPVTVRNEE